MSLFNGDESGLLGGPLADGMSTFVAAAHELKSPLSLIRQLSLALDDPSVSELDKQRLAKQIILTSERALRLTSDLTKSVRLDDGMFELEPINPYQLCDDVVKEMQPLFEANRKRVCLRSRYRSHLVVANRDLLRRIVTNFSDNALKYSDSDRSVEIRIVSRSGGEIIRVGVRDFGPSLTMSALISIKNRLAKSYAPIQNRPLSSGLGLYITSQFADVMNGRIGVTKHRDGATFYVDLYSSKQMKLL